MTGAFSFIGQEMVGFQPESPKAQDSCLTRGGKEEPGSRAAHKDPSVVSGAQRHSVLGDFVSSET